MENREGIRAICQALGCEIRENVPMREYTSFRIGGPVPFMIFPEKTEQIAAAVQALHEKCRIKIVGCGSNLLASDEEVECVVIRLGQNFSRIIRQENTLICEAGATMAQVCRAALENSLTGLEFAWGIPGSIGGGAYMNAGAYGGEFKNVVSWCEHLDENGKIGRFSGEELDYRYRHSAYSGKKYCILRAALELSPGDPGKIKETMTGILGKRKEKQPLEFPSAGSTFKRPEGAFAAALIEKCGLKGMKIGGAQVSTKHSGFIINTGNATCEDVMELVKLVQKQVQEQTGYRLEREVELFS